MPIQEKTLRNRAVIALHICGFSLREIAEVVGGDRRNIQMFCKKYKQKYLPEIMERLTKKISNGFLKPTEKGGN